MDLFDFLGEYFWVVCLVVISINSMLAERSSPERRKYLGWFWGLSMVPWFVMGIGQTIGGVPKIWAYFRPQDGNPYVWAFYVSILLVYLVVIYWVLFRDGARIASEHRLM